MRNSTRITMALALGATIWLGTPSIASAEVQLTIQGGRVSLVANDATLREILMAWAAVGHTTIVNAERVPGGTMTLQLTDVPEEQALETLLRTLSGYIAAPRATPVAGFSLFDRILVMPTIATPVVAAAAAPAPLVEPRRWRAGANATLDEPAQSSPNPTLDGDDGRSAPPRRRTAFVNGASRPQGFNPEGPDRMAAPAAPASAETPGVIVQPNGTPPPAAAYPGGQTTPAGSVSVPGMIVAPPPQPGQPSGVSPPPRRPGSSLQRSSF
jgi:hypothetical protein